MDAINPQASSVPSSDAAAPNPTGSESELEFSQELGVDSQSPGNPLREALASHNVDVSSYTSDEELANAIRDSQSMVRDIPRLQQMASYGQEYIRQQQQQQQAASEEKASEKEKPEEHPFKWDVPEYDDNWERVCEYNGDAQRYVIKQDMQQLGISPVVADKLTNYRNWEMQKARELVRELPSLLDRHAEFNSKSGDARLSQMIDDRIQQVMAQTANYQKAANFLQDNYDSIYRTDANGEPVVDPATGDTMLTDYGQLLQQHAEYASMPQDRGGLGLPPERVRDYATNMAELEVSRMVAQADGKGESQPSAPGAADSPTASQISAQQKQNFIHKASQEADVNNPAYHSQNRDTRMADAANSAGARQFPNDPDFGTMLEQDFKDNGLIPTTGVPS